MRQLGLGIAVGVALLAAGCSKSGDSTGAGAGGSGEGATASAASGGDWKATDACALMPKDKVAAAAGTPVKEAELSGQMDGGGTSMSVSTCSYTMADGSTIGVTTTLFPDKDSADGASKGIAEGGAGIPKSEPVDGIGSAAYWNSGLRTLYVFYGEPRSVAFSIVGPKAGSDPKATTLALAKAFG